MRGKQESAEFPLVAFEGGVAQELAVALEVRRTGLLCDIATRAARRLTRGAGDSGATRHLVGGLHGVRE